MNEHEITQKDISEMIEMRSRGTSKRMIMKLYGISDRRLDAILGENEDVPDDIWIVCDKTCKGCSYYSHGSHGSGTRTCDYTFYTGHARTMPPCECIYKTKKAIRPIVVSKYQILGKPSVKDDKEET